MLRDLPTEKRDISTQHKQEMNNKTVGVLFKNHTPM